MAMSAKFTRRIGWAQAPRGVALIQIEVALVLVAGTRGFKTPRPGPSGGQPGCPRRCAYWA
jgi:hypothetical protein